MACTPNAEVVQHLTIVVWIFPIYLTFIATFQGLCYSQRGGESSAYTKTLIELNTNYHNNQNNNNKNHSINNNYTSIIIREGKAVFCYQSCFRPRLYTAHTLVPSPLSTQICVARHLEIPIYIYM